MVCAVWTEAQWLAVDATVAKLEAKALLKASGQKSHTKGKVSHTDVSAGKPKKSKMAKVEKPIASDNMFYNLTDTVDSMFSLVSPHRSPECRRRNEALEYART